MVMTLVFGDVLFLGLHRPVRCGESSVKEEGLTRVGASMFPDEGHGVVRDCIGVIELFRSIVWVVGCCDKTVVTHQCARIPEAAGAMDRAIVAIEATLQWPVACVL